MIIYEGGARQKLHVSVCVCANGNKNKNNNENNNNNNLLRGRERKPARVERAKPLAQYEPNKAPCGAQAAQHNPIIPSKMAQHKPNITSK